jgi:hypothetical protein
VKLLKWCKKEIEPPRPLRPCPKFASSHNKPGADTKQPLISKVFAKPRPKKQHNLNGCHWKEQE